MSTVPRLIAFDLDGTLWDPEMYQLDGGAPFRRDSDGNVYSSAGEQMHLLGATRSILQELATDPKWAKTKVVGACLGCLSAREEVG